MSSQPSPVPGFVQVAGEVEDRRGVGAMGPAQQVGAPARARGEPGLGTDPESCSPQHSGEQGRRISIHLPSLL